MKLFIMPIIATICTFFSWFMSFQAWQYQWKDNGNGTITSRKYGTYPKEVKFKPGMNIMPGQSARVEIPMNIVPGVIYDGEGNPVEKESQ